MSKNVDESKEKEISRNEKRKRRKPLRRVLIISIVFSIWIFLAEFNSSPGSSLFTNLNIGYILMGFLNFVAQTLKAVIVNIGTLVNEIGANPFNLKYLSGSIAAIGIVPLYLIVRKGSESGATAMFVALMYLFYSTLISPSWFTFLYLGVFPTLFLWGLLSYMYGRKILTFIFMLATIFIVPVSAFAVFVFSICAFYKNWEKGNEGFLNNPGNIFLESVSGFVFIVFLLRYSYSFFIQPSLVHSSDSSNLLIVHAPYNLQLLSAFFANIMPLVPEFTSYSNLAISGVVIGVVGVMGGITRATIKKVNAE